MDIAQSDKDWIDNSSYEGLLRGWRYAAAGDPILQGETGKYYVEAMEHKRAAVGPGAAVAASKAIGWGG